MRNPEQELADRLLKKYGVAFADRQIALKGHWQFLMQPGRDMSVRVYAYLQLHALGYPGGGGEFCITRVGKLSEKDPPNIVPVTPTLIITALLKVEVEALREIGQELTDVDRKKRKRTQERNICRTMEILEREDGAITRVTVTKFLSPDAATRQLGKDDLRRLCGTSEKRTIDGEERWVQATYGLFCDEARAQKLITPIGELSKRDRQRLAGRSFVYLHVKPRPATLAALTRRTVDDFTGASSGKTNGLGVEYGAPVQMVLRLMRAEGLEDHKLAAVIAEQPDVRSDIEKIQQAEDALREAKTGLKDRVHAKLEVFKEDGALPSFPPVASQVPMFPPVLVSKPATPAEAATQPRTQPSAVLNPAGMQTPSTPSAAARTADTKVSTDDLAPVATAMLAVGVSETKAVNQLFDLCRAQAPDCTPDEVVIFVNRKIAIGRGKRVANWTGWLHTFVPPCFEAPGFEAWRVEQRRFDEDETRAREADSERALSPDSLRYFLETNAAAVPYPEIADSLRALAARADSHSSDLESLEGILDGLEKQMIAIARARQTTEQASAARDGLEDQLRPYRRTMTKDQLAVLEAQYQERNLLETADLPRLSLFYFHGPERTRKAGVA